MTIPFRSPLRLGSGEEIPGRPTNRLRGSGSGVEELASMVA